MLEAHAFPKDMSELEVDCSNMRKCLVSGLFWEKVTINGEDRKFYTYLTPGLTYTQKCLIIAPPDDIPVLEFIEKGFWVTFAEKEKVFLHFLEPEHKWKLDGTDSDYMNKVYIEIQSRKHYVTIQDNVYGVGFGKGATVAQQAAMKMTSEWSGLATFGDLEAEALLNQSATQEKENIGKAELSIGGSKGPLPVWMLWEDNNGTNLEVCEYWKQQNDSVGERFFNAEADEIYFPSTVHKKSSVNEEKIAQVRITNRYSGNITMPLFEKVWGFVSMARRHRSFGSKALRGYKDPMEYGAKRHTIEINGFTRCWYEYVPEHVKANQKPVPLVVNMHGRGGSAESFMDISCLNCVAEERDFIAVFPEAGIYQQSAGGIRNVLLWNGIYKDEEINDVAFILAVINHVKSRYEIDEKRIYACGQSSGGMMASELALRAPEVFAAVSPWSAIKDPDRNMVLPTKIEPAVPYLFLLGENDWLCVDKKNGQMEYKVTEDIADFLRNLIKIYELDEKPKQYQCGEISYYVYVNSKKTPILTVGTVRDMSHANYPGESWIAYDEFFAKFSKEKNGTLMYLGESAI